MPRVAPSFRRVAPYLKRAALAIVAVLALVVVGDVAFVLLAATAVADMAVIVLTTLGIAATSALAVGPELPLKAWAWIRSHLPAGVFPGA